MTDPQTWSTSASVAAAVRRQWDSGLLLTRYGRGDPFRPIEVPLRGPSPGAAATHRDELVRWRAELERGTARRGQPLYDLTTRAIGGRAAGRHAIPVRAVVRDYDAAFRLLGTTDHVQAFDRLLAETRETAPQLVRWVLDHPLRATRHALTWSRLLATADWLRANAGTGRYLREIDLPGVDTKFVESHQGLLADLVDALPEGPVAPGRSRGREFAVRYGFRAPEPLVRVRAGTGLLPGLDTVTEVGMRRAELDGLVVGPCQVLVVENEVTYLSVPARAGLLVIFGNGYTVAGLGKVSWLAQRDVWYWGDLDSHGFAILNSLRAGLPRVRSCLMDRRTLLAHEDRWGTEPAPTRARLERLTPAEGDVYADLVEDVFGPAVRLEQERIGWSHVLATLELVLG